MAFFLFPGCPYDPYFARDATGLIRFMSERHAPFRYNRPMHTRASALIERLGLKLHPEGGYYREVYSSPIAVSAGDGREGLSALTTIYFLLAGEQYSRFHRVRSDEVWHFYEGDELELYIVDADTGACRRKCLGPVGEGRDAVTVVPAGCWQAARSTGDYTLAGCSMGPGFRFEDFEMLGDVPEEKARLLDALPELDYLA